VRKHLSRVKGGGLARAAGGARVVSLVVSDVVGSPLDVIASGPTAPDPTTYGDALFVLAKHGLSAGAPPRVLAHLERGARGELPETEKRVGSRVSNVVVGDNRVALEAAAREARRRGWRVLDLGSYVEGESKEIGFITAGMVLSAAREGRPAPPPLCILSGGETTVTLGRTHGRGGRNQELVLAALSRLGETGLVRAVVLSGGTDGEDGPTDAAGAVADARVARAARPLDAQAYLARHDAHSFFARTGGLLETGPTGTNVMDLRVVLVGR
jgi:glycerate-2-kinase